MNVLPDDLLRQIETTYAQVSQAPGQPAVQGTVGTELEIRFYGYNTNLGVSRRAFNRILEFFSGIAKPIVTHTTDYRSNNIRKTVTTSTSLGDQHVETWSIKERVWNRMVHEYRYRVAISREVENIAPVEGFRPESTRVKDRKSFMTAGGSMRLDLTVVNSVDERHGDSTTYEVELEVLNPRAIRDLPKNIGLIMKQLHDTAEIYSQTEYNAIVDYVNTTLGGRPRERGTIDHRVLYQMRNLHLVDMQYGGLVGNSQEIYTVTHKADGVRKLLVFHPTSVWLVMAPDEANLVFRLTNQTEDTPLTGTILEGELVPVENRKTGSPNSTYWFLAFDTLAAPEIGVGTKRGSKAIQKKPHSERLRYAKEISKLPAFTDSRALVINTKTFKAFNSSTEFFAIMRIFQRQIPSLPYKDDGYIFTPENMPYDSGHSFKSLSERKLTRLADICKWKPTEQMTIDFSIEWINDQHGKRIELYSRERGELVIFKGTDKDPYTPLMVDSRHELTNNIPSGTVVEYGWNAEHDVLTPYRIRTDKNKPNGLEFAKDNWDLIHHPIHLATILGEDFTLLRRYHNRIKWDLYNRILEKFPGNDQPTLLDIGSGRGGDVAKWRNIWRIVAVEPNHDHIYDHLIPRIQRFLGQATVQVISSPDEVVQKTMIALENQNKVIIVKSGGEATDLITNVVSRFIGGRVDAVTMMLSMSFFWQSADILDQLVATVANNISPTGEFAFITINGDTVQEIFQPKFKTGYPLSELKLGPADLRYDDQRRTLWVNIPGTIVEDQTEWLVRLDDLRLRFRLYGFKVESLQRADREGFLNDHERIMTTMYSYGWFSPIQPTPTPLPGSLEADKARITTVPGADFYAPAEPTTAVPVMAVLGPGEGPLEQQVLPELPIGPGSPTPGQPETEHFGILPSPQKKTQTLPKDQPGQVMQTQTSPITTGSPVSPLGITTTPTTVGQTTLTNLLLSPVFSPGSPATPGGVGLVSPVQPVVQVQSPLQLGQVQPQQVQTGVTVSPVITIPPVVVSPAADAPPQVISEGKLEDTTPPAATPGIPGIGTGVMIPPQVQLNLPTVTVLPPGGAGAFDPMMAPMPSLPQVFGVIPPKKTLGLPMFQPRDTDRLPMLSVVYDPATDRGRGDDISEVISCKWYRQRPVVRIAAIGDGSCFFHSTMKAYLPSYANNPSYIHRSNYVAMLRRDLAYLLQTADAEAPGKTLYETAANGQWATMAGFQREEGTEIADELGNPIDYSLDGMQRLLNSKRDVGTEVFGYVSKLLGVGINVMIATRSNLVPSDGGIDLEDVHPYSIFIAGNGYHYEVIGVQIEGVGIQTAFKADDPFMTAFHATSKLGDIRSSRNVAQTKLGVYLRYILVQLGDPNILAILEGIKSVGDPQIVQLAETYSIPEDATSEALRNNVTIAEQLYEEAVILVDIAADGENVLDDLNEIISSITRISEESATLVEKFS